jgi:hypothetical protein
MIFSAILTDSAVLCGKKTMFIKKKSTKYLTSEIRRRHRVAQRFFFGVLTNTMVLCGKNFVYSVVKKLPINKFGRNEFADN